MFYVIAAICAFIYQTLDAVDGKQARRTNTSGPLGQLFDHGCDALANTIGGTLLFQALQLGADPDLSGLFMFYIGTHVSLNKR